MEHEDEEWIVQTLMEFERKSCISKVLNVVLEAATSKGDNYSSEIQRLKMKVILHSGEIGHKSLICKCLPSNQSTKELIIESMVFIKERRMLSEVLPAMDKMVQKLAPGTEPFFPRFIGAHGNSKILLEDLKSYGYTIAGNRKGLDFDHCGLLMKTVAQFHALGAILIQNGDINTAECFTYYFERKDLAQNVFKNNFNDIAWILENRWKGEWIPYAQLLKNAADKVGDDLMEKYERNEKRFLTLLHGDCWANNLMFKYDQEGKPSAVRLVDFQLCWYNTVGFDLNYFLWTSAHTEVRPRKAELIKLYHESLSRHLRLYGFAKEPPSLEDVVADVERTALFGLTSSVSFLEFMMQPRADIPDMEKLSKGLTNDPTTSSFIDKNKVENENYRRTMEYIIKEAGQLGLI